MVFLIRGFFNHCAHNVPGGSKLLILLGSCGTFNPLGPLEFYFYHNKFLTELSRRDKMAIEKLPLFCLRISFLGKEGAFFTASGFHSRRK